MWSRWSGWSRRSASVSSVSSVSLTTDAAELLHVGVETVGLGAPRLHLGGELVTDHRDLLIDLWDHADAEKHGETSESAGGEARDLKRHDLEKKLIRYG